MENCTQNDGGVAIELRVGLGPLPRWEKLAFMYISIMLTMGFLGPCVGARSGPSATGRPPRARVSCRVLLTSSLLAFWPVRLATAFVLSP